MKPHVFTMNLIIAGRHKDRVFHNCIPMYYYDRVTNTVFSYLMYYITWKPSMGRLPSIHGTEGYEGAFDKDELQPQTNEVYRARGQTLNLKNQTGG